MSGSWPAPELTSAGYLLGAELRKHRHRHFREQVLSDMASLDQSGDVQ
jgi:hypothetical protein